MNSNTIEKPVCKLAGENGNIYNLTALAANALKRAGQREQAIEMKQRVSACSSYADALLIIQEYVDVE